MTILLEEKVDAISTRIGFPLTRTLLGGSLKVTALGLAPLTQKIAEIINKDPSKISLVDDFYKSTLIGGNLYCKCYKYDDATIVEIIRRLNSLQKNTTPFDSHYPYPITREELSKTDNNLYFMERMEPTGVDSFHKYIFTSRNSFSVRKPIDKSSLKETDDSDYDSDEIGKIYIQIREQVQTFNSILISRTHGIILVCADCSTIPQAEASAIFSGLEAFIKNTLPNKIINPVNFFGCIENLYVNTDGYISSIHFVTGDGNSSSLNLKNGLKCIKNDSYHQSGEQAAGTLLKYEITKYWNFMPFPDKFISIALSLTGKKTMIENVQERLNYVFFPKCPSATELNFLVQKLIQSIPK